MSSDGSPTQAPWRKRTILFLLGQCITLFGSTMVQMAIVWYVTLRTTSGVWVAAFTICAYLPQFLISFIGGVWADRYDRKRLIIGADAAIAAVTLVMLLLMPRLTTEPALLAGLLVMSALRSLGAGVQTPAVNATLPLLVPEAQLMRYNGINATMQSIVQFAAPAAAGALLSVASLRAALLVDIVTAVFGISLLAGIRLPKQAARREKASVRADIGHGVRYACREKLIGKLLLVYGLFIFLSVPGGFLAQLLVSRIYGDTYWHLTAVELTGFFGMIAGGLLMSVWGGCKRHTKTLCLGLAAFGAFAVGMGLARHFILYLALMLLYGVALTMVQTTVTTLIQKKAAAAMQGRIFGLLSTMYAGFLPIGMAIFGPLADMIPLPRLIIASGVALLILAALCRGDKQFYLAS